MFRNLLLALALLLFTRVAHAKDEPVYAPAPAWVKPAAPIDAASLTHASPIFLLYDQQQRLQDSEVWSYTETAFRISTPEVLGQVGTIQFPWMAAKGDLTIHKVEIIRGTEHIDLIAAGQRFSVLRREQQLEQAALNGMLTATLPVEGLRVGDVLHVAMSIRRKDAALRGNVQAFAPLIAAPMPFGSGRVRLLWPKGLDIRWRSLTKDAPLNVVDTPDGYREMNVVLPIAKPADMPGDAPMRFRPLPVIEATSYADWASVSSGMAPLFATEGTIAPNGPIAAEIAKIAAASPDSRARAALALQLVQDKIRYLYRGMDDGDYTPQKPEQTWSLRYGDCKAKTLLLLAILRELGIEAEAVVANVGMGDIVPLRLPSPMAFNHVLVRATIGGEALWLDGTGRGTRLADLSDSPPLRYVLPLRAAGAELMPVPMHRSARPDTDAEIDVDASAGIFFPAPFKARVTLRGARSDMMRMVSTQQGKEQADLMVDGMLGGYLPEPQIDERDVNYDEATGVTTVTASGITSAPWKKDAGRYKLVLDRIATDLTFAPDRGRPAWRDIPVATGEPANQRVVTRVRLPDGGKGFALEGDQTLPPLLAGNPVSRSVSLAGGVVTVEDRMTTGVGEIAPADIPATRRQVALAKARLLKVNTPADYPPRWRQVAAAKKAKAFDAALAVYARRIAADPDSSEGYLARAGFLETIYDIPGAIRDLDKAIAIDPSANNYAWRGRLWEATGDDKRAVADFEASIAADPGETYAPYQLATLRARGGATDEALTMVAERIDAGGEEKNGFVMLQATLLADAGRVDEGLAALDAAIAETPGNADLLNSRCWLKGTREVMLDTALKDCTKSIELSDNPANVLDSRGMVYFRMGRFEDALVDFNAALDMNPDLAATMFMRAMVYRRMGNAKAGEEDLAAARTIDPNIDREYAKYGIKP